MTTNYRIYFNLHKKTFSIKSKKTGLVIGLEKELILHNVTPKVYEKGRQRVIKEKRKNVHAYLDCESYTASRHHLEKVSHSSTLVYYNPYRQDRFTLVDAQINYIEDFVRGDRLLLTADASGRPTISLLTN